MSKRVNNNKGKLKNTSGSYFRRTKATKAKEK